MRIFVTPILLEELIDICTKREHIFLIIEANSKIQLILATKYSSARIFFRLKCYEVNVENPQTLD